MFCCWSWGIGTEESSDSNIDAVPVFLHCQHPSGTPQHQDFPAKHRKHQNNERGELRQLLINQTPHYAIFALHCRSLFCNQKLDVKQQCRLLYQACSPFYIDVNLTVSVYSILPNSSSYYICIKRNTHRHII